MKVTIKVETNLKIKEADEKMKGAVRLGLRDTIGAIGRQSVHDSPVRYGNNRRSLFIGVAGMSHSQSSREGRKSEDTWTGEDRSLLNDSKLEAAIYSTSGYGGFLETGTYKMPARPYIYPAFKSNESKLIPSIKKHLEKQ